ncbi:glycosyl transferase family 1 [Serinibacter arcticus]|uniref:Glycosyl transferase family 1 n=1 Tax=Serinibacter arcticus TaxID=1655435 RepID=A0A2U1ZZ73_9MICO|nr:glycosyltransferase [Serinibacter arcticus]PWD52264.1 glycosyl transferase family 1 [Serinibacter arcticus]
MSALPPATAPAAVLERYRRLVIVVRADPVICGHSVEARNLAEAALQQGFEEVTILTWPIDRLEAAGLPLKPLDRVMEYSPGITVERPDPVGDYRVPDGRWQAGLVGRLIELFTDGVPTVCLSLYLSPHTLAVTEAVTAARRTGLPVDVVTVAEAVGSDITNVVRTCVAEGRFGAAAHVLTSYLANDVVVAVSEYTKELIVSAATEIDARHGTSFAAQSAERVRISYPALDTASYLEVSDADVVEVLERRGLADAPYVLFLSRLTEAKGVPDLITGFERSTAAASARLVIAGRGPQEAEIRALAAASPLADRIHVLTDVDDTEKPALMQGAVAFVLPTLPRPEFVETFGIAVVEKMLAGGGVVATTTTGGVPEAVGDTAKIIGISDPDSITRVLDEVLLMTDDERTAWEERAREYALQFDRTVVLRKILELVAHEVGVPEPAAA